MPVSSNAKSHPVGLGYSFFKIHVWAGLEQGFWNSPVLSTTWGFGCRASSVTGSHYLDPRFSTAEVLLVTQMLPHSELTDFPTVVAQWIGM